jgi:hypothetical protein
MALAPVSPSLLPPVRGTSYIPAFVPPSTQNTPQALFTRVLETSIATGAPLPAAGATAAQRANTVNLLEQSYLRDLISGVGRTSASNAALQLTPGFVGELGSVAGVGRTGLPDAVRNLDDRSIVRLLSSAMTLFTTIQGLGGEGEEGPDVGSLLDITA